MSSAAFVLSTIVILLISRRGTVSEAEHRYRASLHVVPAAELDLQELRFTRLWPAILIAGGCLLSLLMIVFWAHPFRAAIGSDDAWGGEAWLSLGCGFVLVASGLAIRHHLRDP